MKIALLVVFSAFASFLQAQNDPAQAPRQPIEFNHRLHVSEVKAQCKMCHANVEPGEMMEMPEVATCMQCHNAIQPKDAATRKLAALAKQNRDVDWVRIYQIPTYVSFNHRTHIQAGASCETCHGPVKERDHLWKEVDTSMGSCMNCHRAMHASIDCNSCHESR
jgi:ribosomal protein L24E